MACNPFTAKLGDGTPFSGIVCHRGKSAFVQPRCAYCKRPSSKLCDFVVGFKTMLMTHPPKPGEPQTCDKRLCGECARKVGPDKDHCRIHKIRGDEEAA